MDREQFWRQLEPLHGEIEAFCRRLAGGLDEGDDLYQESLLAALRKVRSLRREGSLRPWLYRIVVNTFRNTLRSRHRLTPLTPGMEAAQPGDDPSDQLAARRWIERGLKVLDDDDRSLVTLFEIEGWSIAELADLFEKRPGTIKSRLCRARKKMRVELLRYLSREEQVNHVREKKHALSGSQATSE